VYLNVGGDGNGFVLVVLSRVGKAGDGCATGGFNFVDDRMRKKRWCYIFHVCFYVLKVFFKKNNFIFILN
jgi:hypothetical protein